MIEGLSGQLLGSQVMGAADCGVQRRQPGLHLHVAGEEGEPEIGDLHHLQAFRQLEAGGGIDEQQIGRFDVPVNDLGGGGVREPGSRLPHQSPRDHFVKRAVEFHLPLDVEPLDQLHYEIEAPGMSAEIVGGDDIRVAEPRHGQRLLLEPREGRRIVHLGDGNGFDGDDAIEALLPRPKHHAHPAAADPFENFVSRHNLSGVQQRFDDIGLHGVDEPLLQGKGIGRNVAGPALRL